MKMRALMMVGLGFLSVSTAFGQGSGSHGGDGLVIEFTGTARNLANTLMPLGTLAGCPVPQDFKTLIDQTKVVSEPTVLIDYVEHDAKNDPDAKLITLSRARLINLADPLAYVNLVMHEYFGIMRLEGTNDTSVSQLCLSQIRSRGIDVKSLIYRIDPITTFEKEFANGRAALECTTLYRFIAMDNAILWTRQEDDGFYYAMRRDLIGSVGKKNRTNRISENVSSEYSSATGILEFRIAFSAECSKYRFVSYDHVTWSVSVSNELTSGCTYNGPLDLVRNYHGCTPVYYQGAPNNIRSYRYEVRKNP